jgi:hypothetical protein
MKQAHKCMNETGNYEHELRIVSRGICMRSSRSKVQRQYVMYYMIRLITGEVIQSTECI